jgi:hypothetical protein
MGRPDDSVAELERALAENSAWLYAWAVDPKLDALRHDPRAQEVMALNLVAGPGI